VACIGRHQPNRPCVGWRGLMKIANATPREISKPARRPNFPPPFLCNRKRGSEKVQTKKLRSLIANGRSRPLSRTSAFPVHRRQRLKSPRGRTPHRPRLSNGKITRPHNIWVRLPEESFVPSLSVVVNATVLYSFYGLLPNASLIEIRSHILYTS